jgi:hypothetical protein
MQGILALARSLRGFRAYGPDARDRIMHGYRVQVSYCSFSELVSDYENFLRMQGILALAAAASRITRTSTRDARNRIMHGFVWTFYIARFLIQGMMAPAAMRGAQRLAGRRDLR